VSCDQRVVVVLLDVLGEGVVLLELLLVSPELLELGVLELEDEPVPAAPIELVLPVVPELPRLALPLVELGDVLLLPMALVLPGVLELPVVEEGDVVEDELVEPVVVPVSVRFVQAPSEKAATMARAAHVVLDAFIRKLLEGVVRKPKGRWCPRKAL
jgi:hypothetical protein